MTHHVDDLSVRKRHLQQRHVDFVERHLVGEERLAPAEKPIMFGAREVVITKEGGGVVSVRGPDLSRGFPETVVAPATGRWRLAKLARKASSPPGVTLEWLETIRSTRVVPERGRPMMKIGCGTSLRSVAAATDRNSRG